MAKQVLFIQGGSEGAYDADAKLAASLRDELGPEYSVRYPRMPNESDPDYATWKRVILDELATMGDGAILVGHSIGASVVIRALVDGDVAPSIAGVFLVATPFWHDHDFWRWDDVRLPANAAELLPRDVPLFFYHSRDDESIPFAHVEKFAELFPAPRATVRRLDGRNHQLDDDLSEVARDIERLA